jgi:RHS repeat-associated protein
MRVALTGADDMTCSLPPASLSTRGFTNQEQMVDVCLDNYNARVYDPQIGRFMAADTEIPDTQYSQSYNRYTYVENGPLSYTDPTGHLAIAIGYGSGEFINPPSASNLEGDGGPYMDFDTVAVWSHATQSGTTSGQGLSSSGVTSQPTGPQDAAVAVTPATLSANDAPDSGTDPLVNTPGDQAASQTTGDNASNGAPLANDGTNDDKTTASVGTITYEATSNGVRIVLLETVKGSNYVDFNWVQTVTTNAPMQGKPANTPYPDTDPGQKSPYYFNPAEQKEFEAKGQALGGSTVFTDEPSRPFSGSPISWRANLSLVGINSNGSFDRLESFSYGFNLDSAGVHIQPLVRGP